MSARNASEEFSGDTGTFEYIDTSNVVQIFDRAVKLIYYHDVEYILGSDIENIFASTDLQYATSTVCMKKGNFCHSVRITYFPKRENFVIFFASMVVSK